MGLNMTSESNNSKLLVIRNLDVSYKKLKVLFQVSMEIRKGEVVVIVGRNGSGKTTLFRAISGFLKPDTGDIEFLGNSIAGHAPYKIARSGLRYINQDKQVFADLTVRENMELASYAINDYDWDRVFVYFPKLKSLISRKAGRLSGGERQMLLMAMSLLGKPHLVLMDEPTEGLAPHVINDFKQSFKEISKESTLVIIEQNLPLTGEVADRIYAMKEGKVIAEICDQEQIKGLKFEKYL